MNMPMHGRPDRDRPAPPVIGKAGPKEERPPTVAKQPTKWPLEAHKVQDLKWGDQFTCSIFPGTYCTVMAAPTVEEGQPVTIVCDTHGVTIYPWDTDVMSVSPPADEVPPEPVAVVSNSPVPEDVPGTPPSELPVPPDDSPQG